jgi:Uma2 family endonuclease
LECGRKSALEGIFTNTTTSGSVVAEAIQPSKLMIEVAQLWPPRGQWTETDYFALPDTNRFIEFSEGELITLPHPTHTHQQIVGKLYRAIHDFVTEHDLGTVQFGPLPVRLWPGKIREPAILFVAREHSDRIGEQAYGPPDLVVEVLSPSTRRTDRLEKTVEYARAGVREYWIADPDGQTVELFVLREGAYELLGKWGGGEEARSEVLADFEASPFAVAVDEVLVSK